MRFITDTLSAGKLDEILNAGNFDLDSENLIEYIKKSRKADEKVIGLTSDNTVCVGKQ